MLWWLRGRKNQLCNLALQGPGQVIQHGSSLGGFQSQSSYVSFKMKNGEDFKDAQNPQMSHPRMWGQSAPHNIKIAS